MSIKAGRMTAVAMLAILWSGAAHACACCSDPGDRYVETEAVDKPRLDEINQMAFADTAQVSVGQRDFEDVEGIRLAALPLHVTVRRNGKVWTFSFDDRQGNKGDLHFTLPERVTVFHVDPRLPDANEATGPTLYKEWRLTSKAAGNGMLSGSVGGNQMATLIFHGRGNHCTDPGDFNAWTLTLYGSKAKVLLFGDLKR